MSEPAEPFGSQATEPEPSLASGAPATSQKRREEEASASERMTNPPGKRLAPLVTLGIALVMIGLFVLLAASKTRQNAETPQTPLIGKPAPAIDSPILGGGTFNLGAERGNVIVLNFFQSSCTPCKAEHPELVKFAAGQASQPGGAKLISVVFDDDAAHVQAFFAANGGSWPVINGRGIPTDYGVAQVPETFVIDVNGIVKYHSITGMTADCLNSMATSATDLNSLTPHDLPGCRQ